MVRAHFASDSHSLPNVMYESLLEYIHWIIYAISVLSPWPRVLFESLPFVLRGRREWACYATQPARESRQLFDPRRERIGDISLANFGNAGRDKVKLHFANTHYYYYSSIISIIPWSTRWDRTIGVLWKSRWDTFWDPPPGGLIRPWCCDYRTRRRHKLHNRIWRLKGRAEKKEEEGTNLQVVFLFSFYSVDDKRFCSLTSLARANDGWSTTAGFVLGIAKIMVMPPARAAAVQEAKSSL